MMQLEPDTEVCVCNSKTAKDIAECIKKNNYKSVEELYDDLDCDIANKCESCKDEGFHNDGINIPLVFALTKQGKL